MSLRIIVLAYVIFWWQTFVWLYSLYAICRATITVICFFFGIWWLGKLLPTINIKKWAIENIDCHNKVDLQLLEQQNEYLNVFFFLFVLTLLSGTGKSIFKDLNFIFKLFILIRINFDPIFFFISNMFRNPLWFTLPDFFRL